jgi:hypothetical protein
LPAVLQAFTHHQFSIHHDRFDLHAVNPVKPEVAEEPVTHGRS